MQHDKQQLRACHTSRVFRWWQALIQPLIIFGCALLASCGGSSSTPGAMGNSATGQACDACGSAILTISDAQGDFLTYSVNVVSISLKRADGTTVETLPNTTTVDFAQLVNLSEVISARQIPAGNYVSGSITLDYTNANIVVDDGSASGLKVTAVDSMGAALAQVTLGVQLDSGNKLVITPRKVAGLALDFNLLASNTVNTASAQVTVNPVLTATLMPASNEQIRVRGPLASVDTANSSYSVDVHPFHDNLGNLGQLVVNTNSTTSFNIKGVTYTGSAGLAQLAMAPAATITLAYGTLSTADHSFTASKVLAGTSVFSNKLDRIEGSVIARNGNVLTVRGAFWCRPGDEIESFERKDVMVTVGDSTQVTKDGHMGSFTIADISVGQHAVFFGVANSGSSSSSSSTSSSSSSMTMTPLSTMAAQSDDLARMPVLTLDATAGSAQLVLTNAWGVVSAKATGTVTLNLQVLDGRAPAAYNFMGTGSSTANDAVATAYVVSTGALDLNGITNNTAARFLGFVTPFGMAPPDFSVDTLINYAQTNAVLFIHWDGRDGVANPFATLSSTAIGMSQATLDSSDKPIVLIGPQAISLLTSAAHTTGINLTAPDASATWVRYAINHRSSHQTDSYASFGDFEMALQTDLTMPMTNTLLVTAVGGYDGSTATLKASQAVVVLSN